MQTVFSCCVLFNVAVVPTRPCFRRKKECSLTHNSTYMYHDVIKFDLLSCFSNQTNTIIQWNDNN